MKKKVVFNIILLLLAMTIVGCGGGSVDYDTNVEIPKGDPGFPSLGQYWVIDSEGILSKDTVQNGDAICQRLQEDKIAEVVVVVITGVKRPDEWATHYGRWLKLGRKGFTVEGGNNGVVWLIRPDAEEKVTISVGRGLPEFSTVDYGKIMDKAIDYLNFGNFDKGVMVIVQETDNTLRRIKIKRGGSS